MCQIKPKSCNPKTIDVFLLGSDRSMFKFQPIFASTWEKTIPDGAGRQFQIQISFDFQLPN
jgi:hypothetical protein